MLVVKKSQCTVDNEVHSVDLPIVLATCGWQFEEIDLTDAKFSGIVLSEKNFGKAAVVSTDGGKLGTNPRVYIPKAFTPHDRVYILDRLMSTLNDFVCYLGVDMDMSMYYGKWCYESSKYTLSNINGNLTLTHYFMVSPFSGDDESLERKIVYRLNSALNVEDVSAYGFTSGIITEDVKEYIKKEFTYKLQLSVRPVLLSWKEINGGLNIESNYLEVVRGATEIVHGGKRVRQKGMDGLYVGKYLSGSEEYVSYIATAAICSGAGFTLDESVELTGENAICVAY